MDELEEFRKRDYRILKELIGEEKAKKHTNEDNYHIKRVFFIILIASIKKYAKEKPFMFVIWVLLLVLFVLLINMNKY